MVFHIPSPHAYDSIEFSDEAVRWAIGKALKKCPNVSKVIGLEEMEEHERLDITTPIEKS